MKKIKSWHQVGISLLEMSMVLTILGVIGVGMANFYSKSDIEQKLIRADYEVRVANQNIRKFYIRNNRLPCPDSNNDGFEDCSSDYGRLPYQTLIMDIELVNGDSEDRIHYAVARYNGTQENNRTDLTLKRTGDTLRECYRNKSDSTDQSWMPEAPTERQAFISCLRRMLDHNKNSIGIYPGLPIQINNLNLHYTCSKSDLNSSAYIIAKYIHKFSIESSCFPLNDNSYMGKIIKVSPEEIIGNIGE